MLAMIFSMNMLAMILISMKFQPPIYKRNGGFISLDYTCRFEAFNLASECIYASRISMDGSIYGQ